MFKEDLSADLDVFIDMDEFAEEHDLNGTKCMAIVEAMTTKERAGNYGGIHGSTITVHAKKADLPEVPLHGEIFRLDGKVYVVDTCDNNMGILTIRLEANDI